jgi:hypothetical protein
MALQEMQTQVMAAKVLEVQAQALGLAEPEVQVS